MIKIVNYDKALDIFNNYIRESVKDNDLDMLFELFRKIPEAHLLSDIKKARNMRNLFTMPAKQIKEYVDILNNDKRYKNLLTQVRKYKQIEKKKRKYFKPDEFALEEIITFCTFQDEMKKLYDKFCDKKSGVAYKLIKALNIRACPYCNLNYIDPIIKTNVDGTSEPVLRSHLDHFYSKSKYPFFTLSFFNLIPSCYECNSGLKKDNDFVAYPYLDNIDDVAHFGVNISEIGELSHNFSDLDSFEIQLLPNKKSDLELVTNIQNEFELNLRYSYRKEEAVEILARKAIFDNITKNEVAKNLKLCLDEKTWNRILYGNYLNSSDIHKRPLAKLTKDLINM